MLSAAPDGYTLGLVTNGTSISAAIFKALPFDPVKEFTTVSTLGYFNLVLATNAAAQYKTLGDFIAAAKAQPGTLNVGTINIGSTQHLGAELFKATAGIDFAIVPYRTTPEVTVGLVRNDVQMLVEFYAAIRAPLTEKTIRPVGTSGTSRAPYLKDVPTVAEAGVTGYEVTSWNGIFAPNGTPKEIVDTINKAMHEILGEPDVQKRYLDLGIEARASSPEELRKRLADDIVKWSQVIERAKIPKQ